jgi:anti-sigma B factor antagonist
MARKRREPSRPAKPARTLICTPRSFGRLLWSADRHARPHMSQSLRSFGKTLGELSNALFGASAQMQDVDIGEPPSRRTITCNTVTWMRTDAPTACRLCIEGVLDVHTAPEIRAVFDSIACARPVLVTIELDGLTWLDSSGVGAIVSLLKRVSASGGSLIVQGARNQPLALCKLLNLDRVFRGSMGRDGPIVSSRSLGS